jgi:branched-chain amino acid transport system substrate-binding protein
MKKHVARFAVVMSMTLALPVSAQERPSSIDIGVFSFLSGPSAAYGLPGKQAADLLIEQINSAGGIDGVPINATYVDEAQGAEGVITEFRRMSQDGQYQAMIAALSSGNCLALAPLSDQLKMPTIGWNCDTHQLYLKGSYDYFYRPNGNTIAEFMAYTLYFLQRNPDVERVALINPDYAFGHDAAEIVKATLQAMKPDVKIVAELFPKLGTTSYQTEISRLSTAKPDVIFSNLWGGDLENFVRQSLPRGLFRQSTVVLALGEAVLDRVALPEGTIVGVLGDGWWKSPDAERIGKAEQFAAAYREKFGEDPVFPSIKMANSILILKDGLERAIAANGQKWPGPEQIVAALKGATVETMTGKMSFRADNDGVVDQVVGTVAGGKSGEPRVLTDMVRYDGSTLLAPEGQEPLSWISTLSPDFLVKQPQPGSYR